MMWKPKKKLRSASQRLLIQKIKQSASTPPIPPNEDDASFSRITTISDYRLFPYDESPSFLQDNKYVLDGYRVHFSVKMCLYSLLRIHNESGNIYTHLLAVLVYIWMIYHELFHTPWSDYTLALISYYTGCIICFSLSTCFHMFNSHSRCACKTLLRCDFAGIIALTTACYIPATVAGFSCWSNLRMFYCTMLVLLAGCTASVIVSETLQQVKYKPVRICFFLGFAIFGILPLMHGTYLVGMELALSAVSGILELYALLMIGFMCYYFKLPERFAPGYFDYYLHSHQIWHVFVLLATLKHIETSKIIIELVQKTDCNIFY